jgi:hypothetical protein
MPDLQPCDIDTLHIGEWRAVPSPSMRSDPTYRYRLSDWPAHQWKTHKTQRAIREEIIERQESRRRDERDADMNEPSFADELREFADDVERKARHDPDWVPMFSPGGTFEALREHGMSWGKTASEIVTAVRACADAMDGGQA